MVVWSETNSGSGASEDQDIVYSLSSNDGSTWSDFEDISEHYYESDSGLPSLASSGDYIYLVYMDNGDYDQDNNPNGNDAANRDGDIFFTKSDDEGESWDSLTVLSLFDEDEENELDGTSYLLQQRVDVAANENYVHVAWIDYDSYNGGYDIYYIKSNNNGNTWSEPSIVGTASSPGGTTIQSSGSTLLLLG